MSCAQGTYDSTPGRPYLARDKQLNTWAKESTKETLFEVAGEHPLSDLYEGLAEECTDDPSLSARLRGAAARVRARNRKHPSLPPLAPLPVESPNVSEAPFDVTEERGALPAPRVGAPGWPKPVFQERAYRGDRGARISAARKALWDLIGDELQALDAGAVRFVQGDDDAWVDYYETRLQMAHREDVLYGSSTTLPKPAPQATSAPTPAEETAPTEPQSQEELDAKWLEEDIELQQRREEDVRDVVYQMRNHSYQERNAAQIALKERHALQRKQRELKRCQEKAALIARLAPVLLREPGNPRLQKQYHDQDWRQATGGKKNSPWETAGDLTRRAVKDAANAIEPDS